MINPTQLRDLITRTLKQIPSGYSSDAVKLLMMIAAHESDLGKYIKQVNGPALGIFQIEPATHDDVWTNGDSCEVNASRLGYVWECDATSARLEYDLQYQILIARQKLFMISEPLPSGDDEIAMANYCKKYWNTDLGKATSEDYHDAYIYYCGSVI